MTNIFFAKPNHPSFVVIKVYEVHIFGICSVQTQNHIFNRVSELVVENRYVKQKTIINAIMGICSFKTSTLNKKSVAPVQGVLRAVSLSPDATDVEDFNKYISDYKKMLVVERKAVESM